MFEESLKSSLKTIFGVKKVSFDQPSDSAEQDCLFIEVETAHNTIKDGQALSKVTGNLLMIGPNDKLTFGFFDKKIKQAEPTYTKPFFFFDKESNTKRFGNLVQRGVSFVYFFDSQYDPKTGTITSINFNEV